MELDEKTIERFWAKVDRSGDCWEWTAKGTPKGYGVFGLLRKSVYAHRLSWKMEVGEIPDGMCVCHRCDNPPCVRPSHLFLGTYADNMEDMVRKERGPKKLSHEDVRAVRERYQAGDWTQKALAVLMEVCPAVISNVVRGATHRFAGGETAADSTKRGEEIVQAKLTEGEVLQIRDAVAGGASQAETSRKFGVHVMTVNHIVHRRTWKHV